MWSESDARLEEACFNYLARQGYTLWASWDISRREGQKVAAGWLHAQTSSVLDEMTTRDLVIATAKSRLRRWRARWQKNSISMKSSVVWRSGSALQQKLRRLVSSAATHTFARLMVLGTSLRSRLLTASSSASQDSTARHEDTDEAN